MQKSPSPRVPLAGEPTVLQTFPRNAMTSANAVCTSGLGTYLAQSAQRRGVIWMQRSAHCWTPVACLAQLACTRAAKIVVARPGCCLLHCCTSLPLFRRFRESTWIRHRPPERTLCRADRSWHPGLSPFFQGYCWRGVSKIRFTVNASHGINSSLTSEQCEPCPAAAITWLVTPVRVSSSDTGD
jgi:hypothetical protein